jgi:hypothetical protein
MKTGTADLPLHAGHCPKWLFEKMVKLSGAIAEAIILEFGKDEFLRRLSNPYFFQSLGCVIGFDWHSSGLTTTVCGALKEAIKPEDLGIAVLGGKGKASRKTPQEIENLSEIFSLKTKTLEELKYASKMSAKVDNTAIQDGYQLYHHVFIVSEEGKWTVIQQGMSNETNYARRYHWLSENVRSYVNEPHTAICCDFRNNKTLNMTAKDSEESRKVSVDIVKDNPKHIEKFFTSQKKLTEFDSLPSLKMQKSHFIINMNRINMETLRKAYEIQPKNYEELLSIKGIGPKTIRALALIGQIVYGVEPSWKDPAKFSFAHGGKDRIPYEIDKRNYDTSIEILENAIKNAKVGDKQKLYVIKRLHNFI